MFDKYILALTCHNISLLEREIATNEPWFASTSASTITDRMAQSQSTRANEKRRNQSVRDSKNTAGGFIHLYDSTRYMITNGHIAANIPCDENSTSPFVVLTGQAPNVTAADLEVVNELSTPGTMCIYHLDIPPQNATVTDVAIQNPTESDEVLPAGSTVVIGVNEITPIS